MVNIQLVEFIKKAIDLGYKEPEIKKKLIEKGWPLDEIDIAFRVMPPQPLKKEIKLPFEKPSVNIKESEITDAFKNKKEPSGNQIPKFSIKSLILLIVIGFLIFVLISFSCLVFFYMNAVMDYTVSDPTTGEELTGRCTEDDCSDMRNYAMDKSKEKLDISIIIGIAVAVGVVFGYKFIKRKKVFLWIVNILYLVFLALIAYMWYTFTKGV